MKTSRASALSAMTLVEVIISMTVLAVAMGGVFATLLQSRRLTEGSIAQNSALTIIQGYLEQMKHTTLIALTGGADDEDNPVLDTNSFKIETLLGSELRDPLWTTPGSPPDLSTLTPGVTPEGVVDNLRAFDILKDAADSEVDESDSGEAAARQVTWASAWPNARTYPTTATIGATDLKMNIWVWITDLNNTTTFARHVFGITIIYTYQVMDGGRPKYFMGSVRAIRSDVKTF